MPVLAGDVVRLRGKLAQIIDEIRRQRDRARKRKRPASSRLGVEMWRIAAVLQDIPGGSLLLARLYVYWYVKNNLKRGFHGISESVDDASLDQHLALLGDEHGEDLAGMVADVDSSEHFRAARWRAEYLTFQWLLESNVRGASPPTSQLFDIFAKSVPAVSRGERFAEFAASGYDKNRLHEWGKTFRRRWHIQFQDLPKANALTDAEQTERVASLAESAGPRPFQIVPDNSSRVGRRLRDCLRRGAERLMHVHNAAGSIAKPEGWVMRSGHLGAPGSFRELDRGTGTCAGVLVQWSPPPKRSRWRCGVGGQAGSARLCCVAVDMCLSTWMRPW